MICFPNAKINIGLYVLGQRPDKLHNIETVFFPIPLHDTLEVTLLDVCDKKFDFQLVGIPIEGHLEENLVVKVFLQLQNEYDLPPCSIYLDKHIPTGAGLGGGSSDAAFMVRMMNEMFHLGFSSLQMKNRLRGIGADCPFFVDDEPAFATGIGDQLEILKVNMKSKWLVLVKPSCSVSTREAYAGVSLRKVVPHDLRYILQQPVNKWRGVVENDFEKSVFPCYPQIAAIKQTLYDMGALYASMSGSGSAVFGIFDFFFEDVKSIFPDCFCIQKQFNDFKPICD